MTRAEAEVIAEAIRDYIDVMVYVAADADKGKTSLQIQRLAYEAMLAALVVSSRHG